MYGKTPKQAAQELQEQLNSQHSFIYESDEQAARREQNSELRGQYELAQPVRRQMEKFKNNHPLSDKDNSLLQGWRCSTVQRTSSRRRTILRPLCTCTS